MIEQKKQPFKKYRSGNSEIVIWENVGQDGTFYNATLQRFYKDKEDQWQTTDSFREQDLLDVASLCELVHQEFRIKASQINSGTANSDS